MEIDRIAGLLKPFLSEPVPPVLLSSMSIYLDVLLRWNARTNLTAVRDPKEIIARHFGESLFAARNILSSQGVGIRVVDVGSGAGFPGVPIKLWAPDIRLTLIESIHKKATFLREVIRELKLSGCEVFAGRVQDFPQTAEVVTVRAVERFQSVLPAAIHLVEPSGKIALLISARQSEAARASDGTVHWLPEIPIPQSEKRIILVGAKNHEE